MSSITRSRTLPYLSSVNCDELIQLVVNRPIIFMITLKYTYISRTNFRLIFRTLRIHTFINIFVHVRHKCLHSLRRNISEDVLSMENWMFLHIHNCNKKKRFGGDSFWRNIWIFRAMYVKCRKVSIQFEIFKIRLVRYLLLKGMQNEHIITNDFILLHWSNVCF